MWTVRDVTERARLERAQERVRRHRVARAAQPADLDQGLRRAAARRRRPDRAPARVRRHHPAVDQPPRRPGQRPARRRARRGGPRRDPPAADRRRRGRRRGRRAAAPAHRRASASASSVDFAARPAAGDGRPRPRAPDPDQPADQRAPLHARGRHASSRAPTPTTAACVVEVADDGPRHDAPRTSSTCSTASTAAATAARARPRHGPRPGHRAARSSSCTAATIDVESSPARGPRFTVRLPRAPAAPARRRAAPRAARPRVLVVDDEPEIAALIAAAPRALRRRGGRSSTTGAEALERLRDERFDAMTLDILMPGMSGFEVLRTLRADPGLRGMPVVVVSVFSGPRGAGRRVGGAQADRRRRARRRARPGDPRRPGAGAGRRRGRTCASGLEPRWPSWASSTSGRPTPPRPPALPRALLRGRAGRRRPARPRGGDGRAGPPRAGACAARSCCSPARRRRPGLARLDAQPVPIEDAGATVLAAARGRARLRTCPAPCRTCPRADPTTSRLLQERARRARGAGRWRRSASSSATRPTCARRSSRSARARQELRRSYVATVRALANAVEARDAYTGKHAERVAAYGLEIARAAGSALADDPRDRVRLPAARRRQGRGPRRDPLQARAARPTRSAR